MPKNVFFSHFFRNSEYHSLALLTNLRLTTAESRSALDLQWRCYTLMAIKNQNSAQEAAAMTHDRREKDDSRNAESARKLPKANET